MKERKVIAPAVVAAISCAFAATTCAVLVSSDKTANAETFSYGFFEYSGCYAETNVAVPAGTGIANSRRGLAIRASASGAEARLKTDVSGEFDLEFLPYSATAYGGSDYESSTYDNSYQDIRTMSLVFTDAADSDNTFTVRLNGGADGNNVTVNASVIANDTAAGVYYYKDNAAYGSTAGNNASGVYTFLYGSSFSNIAVSAGSYAPKNVKPVRIVFDPSEMCVYGYNYGYNAYSAEKRLIWDLSKSDNDGRDVGFTLDGFEKYSVKLVFDDIKRDAVGNVVVYSLNGHSLSNTIVQARGPSCYFGAVSGATLDSELELPVPTVYDPIGGTDEFDGAVRLIKPDGTFAAITADGEELAADEEGYCAFAVGAKAAIDAAGEYTLEYKAKNAAGKFGGAYGRKFTVASEDIKFALSSDFTTFYQKGENLQPPQGGWTVDGEKLAATVKVIDPSGEEVASPYTLTKDGAYTVVYTATADGRTLTNELKCYSLNSNSQLFTVDSGVTIVPGVSTLNTGLAGLKAESTVNNSVVTYASPINIKNKTKDDTLISLMALPQKYGTAAFGQLEIKLTDSNDPTNYVSVFVAPGSDNGTSLVRAASAEQSLSGLNGNGAIESFSGGGTTVLHSFSGVANYTDIREQFIDFRLDYETKRVYIGNKLVCDLDDSEHFIKAWNGFASDEVILSVTIRDMSADRASVLIKEVEGKRIVGDFYRDCVSPTVIAEFDVDNVPTAIVGRKYPILPITVSDNEDDAPHYSVSVTDGRGEEVEIEDGGFVPTSVGKYTMIFVATDFTGNSITRAFTVDAAESVDPLDIAPNGVVPSAVSVGETVFVPTATVAGGCGLETVTVTAIGKTTGTKYTVDASGKLKILVADEYELTYSVTDYLGNNAEHKATMTAVVSSEPIFEGEPELPNIFIAGRSYYLGGVTAYDYKAGAAAPVAVSVSIDGGEAQQLGEDLIYTPSFGTASATVTVIFTATAADGTENVMRYELGAIDLYDENDDLVITRYFKTENIDEVIAGDDYTTFSFTSSDAKIGFVKDVYSHGFELMFDIPSSANNAQSVIITVTDAANPSKKVVFEVLRGGFADPTSKVSVNGLQELTIEGNFFDAIKHLRICYDNDSYAIRDASGLGVGFVKNYADGAQFRGFSDTVDFEIAFGGVSGIVNFNLYKVGNQLMMENDGDYTQPVVVLDGEVLRQVKKGGTLVVKKAKAFDVLGFDTTLSVSVRNNKYEMLLTDMPCDKEYTLTLDEYGEYFVEYVATDDNFNVFTYALVVNVRDDVPPTIEVDTTERVVYVGRAVNIATPKIEDDVELDLTYVFVIDPDNDMINVTGESSFTPAKRGVYTIRYVAIDKAGNIGFVDVIVKAA